MTYDPDCSVHYYLAALSNFFAFEANFERTRQPIACCVTVVGSSLLCGW